MINVQLNVDQVLRDLNALEDGLKDKAIKSGVAEVTKYGLMQLKEYTPKKTGLVKESLTRRKLSQTGMRKLGIPYHTFAVLVGPNKKVHGLFKSRIFNILEGGATRHGILPGKSTLVREFLYAQGLKKKATRLKFYWQAKGKWSFPKVVDHPGIAPAQMLLTTQMSMSTQVQSLFYRGLSNYLERHQETV